MRQFSDIAQYKSDVNNKNVLKCFTPSSEERIVKWMWGPIFNVKSIFEARLSFTNF